jgi:hypothetical protein
MVRPDPFASRLYLSLLRSYSSRVGALLVFATVAGVAVAVATALALAFALTFAVLLLFAVLSQAGKMTASAANAMSPVILRLIWLNPPCAEQTIEFGKHTFPTGGSKLWAMRQE